jgi:hypothetical protein
VVNPVRKAWCLHYLRWIGAEPLALMGCDFDELSAEPDSRAWILKDECVPTSSRWLGCDARNISYGIVRHLYYVLPGWIRDRVRRSVLPDWLQTHARMAIPSKVLRRR